MAGNPNGAPFARGRFRNPTGPAGRGLRDLLRWVLTRHRQPWPRWREHPPAPPPPRIADGQVSATFINHASFLLQFGDYRLLVDPVYSERTSPVAFAGPRRVCAPGLPFAQLPPVQAVLVSHNHYDHCDLPTLRRLKQRGVTLFVTTLGNRQWFTRHGFTPVVELDWWQDCELRPGLRVTVTPTRHFSGRQPLDRDVSLWGGFHVASPARRAYFLGDSGYCEHFREVRERLGPPDLALVPIGSYEPRWFMQRMHVNPAEAVQAHLDLQARQSVGMHFGTFRLTDEGIDEPTLELTKILREKGVPPEQFIVPAFGQTVVV